MCDMLGELTMVFENSFKFLIFLNFDPRIQQLEMQIDVKDLQVHQEDW